ncbi:Peptidyl-prolyl cis-trans isomerase CWC27 like protein, partial [Eufriesea mexicana]
VVMETTVGDIGSELSAKEAPKACRNFIQICVKGYYHDPIFHTQGADPTGTGEGGKIYGEPFKDEFLTRITFLWTRDFNLLSFGEEAEEDNEESVILSKKFRGKARQLAII